jgi:hypothetical protein
MKHDTVLVEGVEYYQVTTLKGVKLVRRNLEIEAMECDVNKMTDIGKITDLFWGFNIVDKEGVVMRKFKFITMYPEKAKKVLHEVYGKYNSYGKVAKDSFRRDMLAEVVYKLIGFTIVKTKDFR